MATKRTKSGAEIFTKKGKVTDDEQKLVKEILNLISEGGEDAEKFIESHGPVSNLDGLFKLRDSLIDGDYLDYVDEMEVENPSVENPIKKQTMAAKETPKDIPSADIHDDIPIDVSVFGDDIDEAPKGNFEPITSAPAKERDYNSPEVINQKKAGVTADGQPQQSVYQPLPEDPDAFQQFEGGVGGYSPEELPPGVGAPEVPKSESGFEIPAGAGMAGPVPPKSGEGTDFSKLPPRPSALGSKENPLNPAMNDLDTKEKREAAAQLTDTILDGYKSAHRLFQYMVTVEDDKLMELELDGKIDLAMPVPISETETITVSEFIRTHNEQAKEQLSYDPHFAKKVREPMIRVFMKKGWGLTDEQFLMLKWGEELGGKLVQVVGIRKGINKTLDMLSKIYMKQKTDEQAFEAKRSEEAKKKDENISGMGGSNFGRPTAHDAEYAEVVD